LFNVQIVLNIVADDTILVGVLFTIAVLKLLSEFMVGERY